MNEDGFVSGKDEEAMIPASNRAYCYPVAELDFARCHRLLLTTLCYHCHILAFPSARKTCARSTCAVLSGSLSYARRVAKVEHGWLVRYGGTMMQKLSRMLQSAIVKHKTRFFLKLVHYARSYHRLGT